MFLKIYCTVWVIERINFYSNNRMLLWFRMFHVFSYKNVIFIYSDPPLFVFKTLEPSQFYIESPDEAYIVTTFGLGQWLLSYPSAYGHRTKRRFLLRDCLISREIYAIRIYNTETYHQGSRTAFFLLLLFAVVLISSSIMFPLILLEI